MQNPYGTKEVDGTTLAGPYDGTTPGGVTGNATCSAADSLGKVVLEPGSITNGADIVACEPDGNGGATPVIVKSIGFSNFKMSS
jgi:hypothetical protein